MTRRVSLLLPNLGAEEGDDWAGFRREPSTRVAAALWSHLFSADAVLRTPVEAPRRGAPRFVDRPVRLDWPEALGERPSDAAYAWLEVPGAAIPWLARSTLRESADLEPEVAIAGPDPTIVARLHDKAFAATAVDALDLRPRVLDDLIEVFSPQDLADAERFLGRLRAHLERWPAWTTGRFTLKPRLGTSGRGRVAGQAASGRSRIFEDGSLRGALPRLAARGGAILEPWLERRHDLSVCMHLDAPGPDARLPTLLGSLEMLTTPAGGYRGHCGEIDHRGRVFSGHALDETLRAEAAMIAGVAAHEGFFGACGIDAFTFATGRTSDADVAEPECLRTGVEFNARATMGLVALGLLRRVFRERRSDLAIDPGDRRAFALILLRDADAARLEGAAAGGGAPIPPLSLASPEAEIGQPVPWLFFGAELESLREALERAAAC